jgi:8-oxo-dGTP pyrophosphatase MutT (NUDIX family)
MKKRDVSVLFTIKRKAILLQKRGAHLKRFPNTYGLFGGGVKMGENHCEALQRELKEEANINNLENIKLILTSKYTLPEYDETGNIYVYSGKIKIDKNNPKHIWCDVSKLDEMNIHEVYVDIIRKLVR